MSFFFLLLLICSLTLFHFSLPSSFHLINKHTLQPTFIEQLGSSVPSHFLTIHRVLWGVVVEEEEGGGGSERAGTPFHLKLLLEEQCTVLGWIRNPSTLLRPNRRERGGTVKPAPLWLSGSGRSCSNSSCSGLIALNLLICHCLSSSTAVYISGSRAVKVSGACKRMRVKQARSDDKKQANLFLNP